MKRDWRKPSLRLCVGVWTWIAGGGILCPCHGIPSGWEDEALPFTPQTSGIQCEVSGCRCVSHRASSC